MWQSAWVSFAGSRDRRFVSRYAHVISFLCFVVWCVLVAAYATSWSHIRGRTTVWVQLCVWSKNLNKQSLWPTVCCSNTQSNKNFTYRFSNCSRRLLPASRKCGFFQSCGTLIRCWELSYLNGYKCVCRRRTYLQWNTREAHLSWSVALCAFAPPTLINSTAPRSQQFLIYRIFPKI